MYQYFNNTLSIPADVIYSELSLISYDAYKSRVARKTLLKTRNACPGQKALLNYEALPHNFKVAVKEKYGDPYVVAKRNAIEDLIVNDQEAIDYFRDYRYDDDKSLSLEKQREYCMNAQILKVCQTLSSNRKAYCKSLGGRAIKIWETLSVILNELDKTKYPHSLPSNPRSLERACSRFNHNSYYGIIHKNYGNDNSEKLAADARFWVLSRWADPVKRVVSVEQLLLEYNAIAPSKGWKSLEDSKSIYNYLYRPDIQEMWYAHRHGELKAKEKFGFQHSTKMPTMRDSLWYSDGTKLNYYYRTDDGKISTISVYEIMDAYSEVLLGYHISESENYVTQYCAYKMALQFAGHKPYQLGFDNQGGHKKLTAGSFISKIAHLAIRTQPYNGKSKTIELAFKRFQEQHLKKDWFFTGQNIQAKKQESKANMEFINANKENLPSLEDIKAMYLQRRTEWNNAPHHATGKPRIEMYLSSVNPETPKVQLWDMVDMFWILRAEPVTYTAYGLTFTEKKQKYTYTVYDDNRLPNMDFHRKNIDKKFFIKFDPEDFSMIYLFEKDANGELRFISAAETKVTIVRGRQEQEEFDTQYLASVQKLNDTARIKRVDEMDEILKAHGMHAEDYGLNAPNVLGLTAKKRKEKKIPTDYGELLKEESELVPILANGKEETPDPWNNY